MSRFIISILALAAIFWEVHCATYIAHHHRHHHGQHGHHGHHVHLHGHHVHHIPSHHHRHHVHHISAHHHHPHHTNVRFISNTGRTPSVVSFSDARATANIVAVAAPSVTTPTYLNGTPVIFIQGIPYIFNANGIIAPYYADTVRGPIEATVQPINIVTPDTNIVPNSNLIFEN